MTHKNILILSTYPIKNPRHGGQKRTDAIYRAYTKTARKVRYSAVFFKEFYDDHGPYDIPLSEAGEQLVRSSPLTGDIICGRAIYDDPEVKQKMTALLQEFQPDIIHIEQPFPYLGLKPLLTELGLHPKLIFGSQNVEAPMKREILESYGAPESQIKEAVAVIDTLERDLSQVCDLLVACTEADMAIHKAMGAKTCVLAKNGIAPAITSLATTSHWQQVFAKIGLVHAVLFVGSAHPPNWVGFLDMVGKGLGFLSRDSRIVAAGSISDYFDREIKSDNKNIEDATFWLRALSAGRLSEESLGSLITLSEIIILPITEGGGSNLKTAEAILANKKVIATEHALRSFEWFKDFPNVWVATNANDFRQAINAAINTPFVERTGAQVKQADTVRWENCLSELTDKVAEL